MIAWSTVLFGLIQLVIVAVHYVLSFGHEHRLGKVEGEVQSIRGKVSNAQQAARKAARKEVNDALDDPANQPEPEGSGMDQMMPMLFAQMMGQGGMGQGQQQGDGQPDETAGSPPVLGSGGSPSEQSS